MGIMGSLWQSSLSYSSRIFVIPNITTPYNSLLNIDCIYEISKTRIHITLLMEHTLIRSSLQSGSLGFRFINEALTDSAAGVSLLALFPYK